MIEMTGRDHDLLHIVHLSWKTFSTNSRKRSALHTGVLVTSIGVVEVKGSGRGSQRDDSWDVCRVSGFEVACSSSDRGHIFSIVNTSAY